MLQKALNITNPAIIDKPKKRPIHDLNRSFLQPVAVQVLVLKCFFIKEN